MSLVAASRSEITKQFTTSAWWILAIVLVVYVGSTAAGLAALFSGLATGAFTDSSGPQFEGAAIPPIIYSLAASIGYVFPLLVGTLAVTTEFRHKTLTPTFLATPRRGIALAAKVVVGVVMGLVFALIALVSAVGPGAAFIAGFGLDTSFASSDTWALIGRTTLALVLWSLIGVGLGTLVRNQVVAIVIVLAFTQFIEPIARAASSLVEGLSSVTNFLPGAASDALVGASIFTGLAGQTPTAGGAPLEWWGGGITLAVYAVVFLLLGHLLSWRRDVT
jgi:hypothetical protein